MRELHLCDFIILRSLTWSQYIFFVSMYGAKRKNRYSACYISFWVVNSIFVWGKFSNIKGYQAQDADLTITIKRSDLEQTMMGAVSFDDQIAFGRARLKGDRKVYEQLKTMLVHFDLGFEILPGTGNTKLTPEQKPFQQEELGNTSGG
ncbi:MAG: alkyl sulfatase C-terminal domain-containing protein [Xenococcus sp. (in: cyanobacteria)]